MAFRLPRPLALPGHENLAEASLRARALQARLIDQLESELAGDSGLTATDVHDALTGARLWFGEERDKDFKREHGEDEREHDQQCRAS